MTSKWVKTEAHCLTMTISNEKPFGFIRRVFPFKPNFLYSKLIDHQTSNN
jgi:hypothetical protein